MAGKKNPQFCAQCGARALEEASFCVECGEPLPGAKQSRVGSASNLSSRFAPLVVVGGILAIGGVTIAIGYSQQPPPNAPIANPPPQAAAAPQPPAGHPPTTIPEEVKRVITRLEAIADEKPDNIEAWNQLAFVQYRAGQVEPSYRDKSEASYKRVLGLDEKNLTALRGLGNVAYDRNDQGKALEYYQRYLEIEPGDKSVRTDMGTMLLSAGRSEDAIRIYRGVLQEDPTFFQAQFNLAVAYRAADQTELALAAMHRSKEIAPDDASRARVAALLANVSGGSPAPPSGESSLRDSVEAVFRSHPIVGPRIDVIEWASDTAASVVLREFPMSGMPPMVREKFVSRLKSGIEQSKSRFNVKDPLTVQIVDATSKETMLTLQQ